MKYIFSIILMLAIIPSGSLAFDDVSTHPQLTEKSVDNSQLSSFLVEQLGIDKGIKEDDFLQLGTEKLTIVRLLQKGSTDEDDPLWRASNHFHDPLKPWGDAQLDSSFNTVLCWKDDTPFKRRYSNLLWATGYESENVLYTGYYDDKDVFRPETVNNDPAVNKGRNWDVARNFYYNYLTAPSEAEKNTNLAELFKTMGYLVHLLQDMAVPAHTRNDFVWGHLKYIGCPKGGCTKSFWKFERVGNLFEGYVRDELKNIMLELNADKTVKISVPFEGEKRLTALWDTDSWAILANESDPVVTTDIEKTVEFTMGLAEYSSANFVSHSTIFNDMQKFPYPNEDSITDEVWPDQLSVEKYEQIARDGKIDKVFYFKKERHGEKIDKFLTQRYVFVDPEDLGGIHYSEKHYELLRFRLDEQCRLDYAKKLIPRAIGYSASLIDYFFRGRIDIAEVVPIFSTETNAITGVSLRLRNTTQPMVDSSQQFEPMVEGNIDLVYSFRTPDIDNIQYFMVPNVYNIAGSTNKINTEYIWIPNEDTSVPVDIPANAFDINFMVIYRGTLGSELNNAVAAQIYNFNNSRLVYGYQPGGPGTVINIHTISPDGAYPFAVTGSVSDETNFADPAWNNDGTRLAFAEDYCEGGQRIEGPESYCEEGVTHTRSIAVLDLTREDAQLSKFAISNETTVLCQLSTGEEISNYWPQLYGPVFRPDGNGVIANISLFPPYIGGIVSLNFADPHNATLLNSYSEAMTWDIGRSAMAWRPLTNLLTYYLKQEFGDYVKPDGSIGRKYLERKELRQLDTVTGISTPLLNEPEHEFRDPAWSRDGEWLAFTSDLDRVGYDVWIMDASGNNRRKVYDCNPGNCFSPTFSPDGRKLAFSSGNQIITIDPFAEDPTEDDKAIVLPGSGISSLRWSPYLTPPSLEFNIMPVQQTTSGKVYRLTWNAARADTVIITTTTTIKNEADGETSEVSEESEVELQGNLDVTPTTDTTYTITAKGLTGVTEKKTTVKVAQ